MVTIELQQNRKGWNRHSSTEKQRTNLAVDMFLRLYERVSPVQVTVDNEYMVQTVKPTFDRVTTEPYKAETRICASTYHHGDRNVPIDQFDKSKRPPYGILNACQACQIKRKEYDVQIKERKSLYSKVAPKEQVSPDETQQILEAFVETATPTLPPRNGNLPNWKVEVIERRTHFVYAMDFMDAAAQFDGKGEIVKVEKV